LRSPVLGFILLLSGLTAPLNRPAAQPSEAEAQQSQADPRDFVCAPRLQLRQPQRCSPYGPGARATELARQGLFPPKPLPIVAFDPSMNLVPFEYVRAGFYDGTTFHRVIGGFMAQGGDPTGTGTGGPGYEFANDPVSVPYTRGVVAMANAGRDTNGSQFFIVLADANLPPEYSVFGLVTSGMDVVDAIAAMPNSGEPENRALDPVAMGRVTVSTP